MKFRKKPVVIDAVQWFKFGDHPAVVTNCTEERVVPWVETLEGGHIVTAGDWIITGVKGEHYPCKPDIFAMTYESVEGLQPATDRERIAFYEKAMKNPKSHGALAMELAYLRAKVDAAQFSSRPENKA